MVGPFFRRVGCETAKRSYNLCGVNFEDFVKIRTPALGVPQSRSVPISSPLQAFEHNSVSLHQHKAPGSCDAVVNTVHEHEEPAEGGRISVSVEDNYSFTRRSRVRKRIPVPVGSERFRPICGRLCLAYWRHH